MKSLPVIFLSLVVGLSVLTWVQHGELNELRGKYPDTLAKLEKTEHQLNGSEANLKELEKQLEEARHPVLVAKGDASLVGANGKIAGGGDTFLSGMAAFMDKPAMQRMMAQQQKAQVDHRFKKLFAQMTLSPEQMDQFQKLLVDREATAMDSVMLAMQHGLNPMQDGAEIQKLVADSQAESDAQIKTLLGDTAYAQYQDYRNTEPQRNTVAQLQQNLGFTESPLNQSQTVQLTQLLVEARSAGSANSPGVVGPGGQPRVSGGQITTDVVDRSRSFLNPTQVNGLIELQQQQQAAAALRASMPAGMGFAPGSKGPGG
ncbi:MAG TPA: hypothetical protein VGM64_20915 [Lacunisphaera sp.]|jgi:hypothetical protein